ncbi:MAG: hypothetical protein H0X12_12185 [Nocardioides sp.]|nr:hypothetical protein [Nocardioides sp.]
MTSWADLAAFAERLPGAVLGEAHDGSPAWYAGRHQCARLRWDDDGHELAQVWTGELHTGAAVAARREAFPVIHTFEHRVSLWCRLDLLEREWRTGPGDAPAQLVRASPAPPR